MSIKKDDLVINLQNDLSEPNLQIFKNSVDVQTINNTIRLIVGDAYMKQWIENKCLSIIKSYVNQPIEIHIETPNDPVETDQLDLFVPPSDPQPSKFNPLFTLDKFIVGNNNRFAFAAAEAVAKRPANAYNPLFIYGSVGIGKT
ncbi:MAG: DnaA ATPase domain-containing protein, partial [Candidatus Marinamargulisbacteria bacterium]